MGDHHHETALPSANRDCGHDNSCALSCKPKYGRSWTNALRDCPPAIVQGSGPGPPGILILALGTNDIFAEAGRKPHDTVNAMRSLVKVTKDLPTAQGSSVPNTSPPKVMIVSPPNCLPLSSVTGEGFPQLNELTRWLPELTKLYNELAIEQDTYFADAAKFCEPDPVDGLHLDARNTKKLGVGIAKILALEGFADFC